MNVEEHKLLNTWQFASEINGMKNSNMGKNLTHMKSIKRINKGKPFFR